MTILIGVIIILIVVIGLQKGQCQSFDLLQVHGYGYPHTTKVDGMVTIDTVKEKSVSVNILQADFRLFRVKVNPVTKKIVKWSFGPETTIELETIGSTSFITFREYRGERESYYLFELVRKFARHDEERTYYTAKIIQPKK